MDADDCPVQPLRHRERREKEHGHRFDLARQVCEERRLLAIDAQKDESDVHGQRDEMPVPEQSHAWRTESGFDSASPVVSQSKILIDV